MTGPIEHTAAVGKAPAATVTPARAAWIDQARGIAILLVVYGHCFRGLRAAEVIDSPLLSQVDYLIYGFHMPLFFFISGALGLRTAMQGGRPFWLRLRAIVWPYLLWMSCELVVMSSLSGLTNSGRLGVGLATYLYAPIPPFWFLYAVLCCVVFVHGFVRFGAAAPLLAAIPVFVAGQWSNVELVSQVSWGLLYYAAGTACSTAIRGPAFERLVASPLLIAASAGAAVVLGLALMHAGVGNQWNVPVAILGSVAVFGSAQHLARWGERWAGLQGVAYLGQISLTILVVHILGTAGARIALVRLIGGHAHPAVYIAAGMAAGLALPLALQAVSTRLGLNGALGLPRIAAPVRRPPPMDVMPNRDGVRPRQGGRAG